jgi:DNA invertase Pin-like site-specific DNA recombinase
MITNFKNMVNKNPLNYFLYARKSTDVEDKQVRSIEDQLAVLRALAKQEGLHIVREFTEKMTAKKPGRPVFNDMMARIERGEAQGIICWKLDRLARNPWDDGQIRWFHQIGVIQQVRTYEHDYQSDDNGLLMSVEFAAATQYVRDLAVNTKRGLNEKVKRGEYPSVAPVGYMNDTARKIVVMDRREAPVVRRAFELYAKGDSRLEDIAAFLHKGGIKTKATKRWQSEGGKPFKRDQVSFMLSNPFYIGFFRYDGELYEGKHPPLISKQLFDKTQEALKARQKPPKNPTNHPQGLCGLLSCGECGRSITAEIKIKRQKNGAVHEYTYYRCTKKNVKCSQPQIRGEELDKQLSTLIKTFAMPSEWAQELSAMADKDEHDASQLTATASQATREEITAIEKKLRVLLEARLEEDIDRDTYREQKAELLSRKKSLEEKMADLNKGSVAWLEPLRNWIKDAETLNEIDETTPLPLKKSSARTCF